MTPKDLMRLALEAGFDVRPGRDGPWDIWATEHSFNRLADLLASACADCEYHKQRAALWRHEAYRLSGTPLPWDADVAIAKAVAAESELIASWVEDMCQGLDASTIAEAIRNGGNDAMDNFKVSE